jgi:predicted DNA-binding protein YlxM (UPF0122 family)
LNDVGLEHSAFENALEKTNRVNLLFDFYGLLLTEKQQTFLKYYFHDNYSLGEIAMESGISRQAVFEHIKRAEALLQDYEDKLQLLHKHEDRSRCAERIEQLLDSPSGVDIPQIRNLLKMLVGLD